MAPPSERQRRTEENRDRLLAAAEELLRDPAQAVTLNDVARQAGLGVGTAYRRFANRDELIDALFEQRLERAVTLARTALADTDAWRGFSWFLETSLEDEAEGRGMSRLISRSKVQPNERRVAEWGDRLGPLLDQMVARAKEQGAIRPEIEPSDVIFLRAGLTAIVEMTRGSPELLRRYLAIVLQGVRADDQPRLELPGAAPTVDESHRSMAAVRWSSSRPT